MKPTARDCALQIQKVIDQIELKGFRYPVHFTVEAAEAEVVLFMHMDVPELATGRPVKVVDNFKIAVVEMSDATILKILRGAILLFLQHELDESLHYQGVQVMDPHGEQAVPRGMTSAV